MAIKTASWEEILPAVITGLSSGQRAVIEYSLVPRRVFAPTKDLGLTRIEYQTLLTDAMTCLRDAFRQLGLWELSDLDLTRPAPCRIHKYGAA